MRKLASVQVIRKLSPIVNADRIELATVQGFHVVVKKGDFRAGDKCLYIETDSIVPDTPQFEFLGSHRHIKLQKIRGVVSQGLALPYTGNEEVGTDLTQAIGIQKYERPNNFPAGTRGEFPGFVPRTDEVRIQNIPEVVKKWNGKVFIVTEKLDGTSVTAYMGKDGLHVCSRKRDLERDSVYWAAIEDTPIPAVLEEFPSLVFQGELCGTKIQGNPLELLGRQLYVFDIYDRKRGEYLRPDSVLHFCSDYHIKTVPYLPYVLLPNNVDEIVALADGASALNRRRRREGIVLRPADNIEMPDFPGNRLSFKVISQEYTLKGAR